MTTSRRADVAVLGFGNQGAAHAALLRASGAAVIVGARAEGAGAARAREQGFEVLGLPEALGAAPAAAMLLPDETLPALWPTLRAAMAHDPTLVFAHGFNLLYAGLDLPPRADVVLVAPTGPGRVLARTAERGERLPAYLAVHQDASGRAWEFAEDYARRLGLGPVWRTTVREETEVDLFGEQVVLCGGMNALVETAFDTLVAAGYPAEMVYLECVHQLRYLAELLNERGPAGLRGAISGTARFGDLTRGPRVIGPESRAAMRAILEEIRDGRFAREWRAEVATGGTRLARLTEEAAQRPIERARERALGGPGGPEATQRLVQKGD